MTIPEDEDSEYSYEELMTSAILNGEIIITIPQEMEDRVKVGLKNFKARQAKKAQEEDLPIDRSLLNFDSTISEDYPDCIDLRIILKKPSTIKIKKIVIPEQLPD
jgi:hypothetical protein